MVANTNISTTALYIYLKNLTHQQLNKTTMTDEIIYVTTLWNGFMVILVDHPTADFAGTKMALTGILRQGESIEQWKIRCSRARYESMKNSSEYFISKIKKRAKNDLQRLY